MQKLTQNRIKEILTDFCSKWFYNPVFDEGFIETTFGCEDEWEDDNSNRMKKSLIENFFSGEKINVNFDKKSHVRIFSKLPNIF